MNNIPVANISLISAFFGLFLLFIISLFAEPAEIAVEDVAATDAADVRIRGRVTAIRDFGSMAVVEVAEIKSVDVVVFDKRMADFAVGSNVTVLGEVRSYRGKKEVIAERIAKLSESE